MLARRGTRELGTGREQENGRNKRWCGGLDREEELKGGEGRERTTVVAAMAWRRNGASGARQGKK